MADDFSLIVKIPKSTNEKLAKEVRSSLENLLNDYFSAFEEIANELNKKHNIYQCGAIINFENGMSFQIIFSKKIDVNLIHVGLTDIYGNCKNELDLDEALVINKYSLEMSTIIHNQRMAAYNKNLISRPGTIEGIYSTPKSDKIPIYKSKDSDYNFLDGPGHVDMRQNEEMGNIPKSTHRR